MSPPTVFSLQSVMHLTVSNTTLLITVLVLLPSTASFGPVQSTDYRSGRSKKGKTSIFHPPAPHLLLSTSKANLFPFDLNLIDSIHCSLTLSLFNFHTHKLQQMS